MNRSPDQVAHPAKSQPARFLAFLAFPAGLAAVVVFAWFLGRLKTLYYFDAFGIGPSSMDLRAADLFFESWFVFQNLIFFVMVVWVVLKSRLVWVGLVGFGYALIPIASHYAFTAGDGWLWLIRYRHTMLKLIPFLLLAIVWLAYPRLRAGLKRLGNPMAPTGWVLLAVISLSWGISAAKHFGSYDANMALRWPETALVVVRLDPAVETRIGVTPGGPLYLLHSDERQVILWDAGDFEYGVSTEVRTIVVPRDSLQWLEGRKRFEVQHRGLYF